MTDSLIAECGGPQSAKRVFQGKIRSVESSLTTTAHSVGKVVIERLGEDEVESDADRGGVGLVEVSIPFMNENLAVIGKTEDGKEEVSEENQSCSYSVSEICLLTLVFFSSGPSHSPRLDQPA